MPYFACCPRKLWETYGGHRAHQASRGGRRRRRRRRGADFLSPRKFAATPVNPAWISSQQMLK